MHGERFGTTVAAFRWRTGELLWAKPSVRNAGHVRFLDANRVLVLGHHDKALAVLDAKTGARTATWDPPAESPDRGHALGVEPGGTVLIVDTGDGRLLRVNKDGVVASSPALGEGLAEAALPE